jgi:hypothetical protein
MSDADNKPWQVHVVKPPLKCPLKYFPHRYRTRRKAIEVAMKVVREGATQARVLSTKTGAFYDYFPPKEKSEQK